MIAFPPHIIFQQGTSTPTSSPTTSGPTAIPINIFQFETKHSGGGCLEPSELQNGKGLRIKSCTSDDVQKWIVSSTGQIANMKDPNYCLTRKKAKPKLQIASCISVEKDLSTFAYDWFDSTIVLLSTRELISIPLDASSKKVLFVVKDNKGAADEQKWTLLAPDGSSVPAIPSKFSIRNPSENKCLRPKTGTVKSLIVVEACGDKKIEKWTSDQYGQIHSQKDFSLCIAKSKKSLILNECKSSGSKKTSFLYNYWDNLIYRKGNPKVVTVTSRGTVKLRKRKEDTTKHVWYFELA